jgi:Mg-chelatase subunit ChlD
MKTVALIFFSLCFLLLVAAQPTHCRDSETMEGQLEQASEAQAGVQPVDIVLVLDNSGSMRKNDPKFLSRKVVTNFSANIGANSRLGLVIFDQDARLVSSLTEFESLEDRNAFLKSLEKLDYRGQFTNISAAIERAIYELKTNGRKEGRRIIVFLTDGIMDTGNKGKDLELEKWTKEGLALESKREGIPIFGVAFTDEADFHLIQTLALKTEGEYFRAYKAEDIETVFQSIEAIINKPPPKPEVAAVQPQSPAPAPVHSEQFEPPQASAIPSPEPPEKGIPLSLILSGIIALLGLFILFFVFRGKSRSSDVEMRPTAQAVKGEAPMPKAQLIDSGGIIFDKPLELTKRNVIIGRDPNSDVVIPKDTVSSLHATIDFKDGYFILEDQRSSNGTSLNGRPIEPNKPVRLKSGDRLKFDLYEFTFFMPGQEPAGKTRLAGGAAAPPVAGTVLRSAASPEKSGQPDQDARPQDQGPGPFPVQGPPEMRPQPNLGGPGEGKETKLKATMCPNHPSLKSTELCVVCKQAYCKKCVTEQGDNTICLSCVQKRLMKPLGLTE